MVVARNECSGGDRFDNIGILPEILLFAEVRGYRNAREIRLVDKLSDPLDC